MMANPKLLMSFDPHTIEHLGIKMYSRLPNAMAELIANAYDADAKTVHINIVENSSERSITVDDDGIGMTFDEINEKFLRIGRQRRNDDNGLSPSKHRKVTGRKGLGKLAFFGIGNTIEVETKRDGKSTSFVMKWSEITNTKNAAYEPAFFIKPATGSGTKIVLKELKRQTCISKNELASSLSKLFNFFDSSFQVFISVNGKDEIKIDDNLKYDNIDAQIEWNVPADTPNEYCKSNNIKGVVIAAEKPLKPGLRGITLFAHGRMVNAPEFFGVGESSHGYSYLTGRLNVDFIDEQQDDMISTDRQSLNWDYEKTIELREKLKDLLRFIEKDWREKRREKKNDEIAKKTKIDVNSWVSKTPQKIKEGIEKILDSVSKESELDTEKQSDIVKSLHQLLPEYTYYHYRHLHKTVQNASLKDYENADYYRAFEEAMKRYVLEVQRKSGNTATDVGLMHTVFGPGKILQVAKKYKRPSGDDFNLTTLDNIEEGQHFLSVGITAGGRNPIAHEEIADLHSSGLFSEDDCLNFLSILSHLFRRLDDA
jgi:uncharacterized protein (TIGR02391 family)